MFGHIFQTFYDQRDQGADFTGFFDLRPLSDLGNKKSLFRQSNLVARVEKRAEQEHANSGRLLGYTRK